MLLSLYAINNRWIRNAVTVLFKKLMPILTLNSVKLIIDLLEPEAVEDLVMKSDGEEEDEVKLRKEFKFIQDYCDKFDGYLTRNLLSDVKEVLKGKNM